MVFIMQEIMMGSQTEEEGSSAPEVPTVEGDTLSPLKRGRTWVTETSSRRHGPLGTLQATSCSHG